MRFSWRESLNLRGHSEMKKILYRILVVIFFVVFSGQSVAGAGCDNLINASKMGGDDEFLDAVHEVKKNGHFVDCASVFMDFWLLKTSKYNGVELGFLKKNGIRIQVADVLLQAEKNKRINIDKAPILDYVRSLSIGDGCEIYNRALLILGGTMDAGDLGKIRKEVISQDRCTFSAASIALASRCDVKDGDVERIRESLSSISRKKFLMDTWLKFHGLRVCSSPLE
jgi:hypothetical protein